MSPTRSPSGLTLEHCARLAVVLWLAWRGLAGVTALGRACAEIDAARLCEAARMPLARRLDEALGPIGLELLACLERLTPARATVFVTAPEVTPAVYHLWAALFALGFPRIVLPLFPEQAAEPAPPSFVVSLAPAGDEPWVARARLVTATPHYELWSVER